MIAALCLLGVFIVVYLFYRLTRQSDFQRQYAELEDAIEKQKTEIGAALIPILTKILDDMADFLERLDAHSIDGE